MNTNANTTPAGVPLDDLAPGVRYELDLIYGPPVAGKFSHLESERGRPLRVVLLLAGGRERKYGRNFISEIRHG